MNIYNEDTTESHLVHSQNDSAHETVAVSCIDESSCDHFCHISSHMVGFISQTIQLSTVDTAIIFPVLNEHFHSLILAPPFQPPQA